MTIEDSLVRAAEWNDDTFSDDTIVSVLETDSLETAWQNLVALSGSLGSVGVLDLTYIDPLAEGGEVVCRICRLSFSSGFDVRRLYPTEFRQPVIPTEIFARNDTRRNDLAYGSSEILFGVEQDELHPLQEMLFHLLASGTDRIAAALAVPLQAVRRGSNSEISKAIVFLLDEPADERLGHTLTALAFAYFSKVAIDDAQVCPDDDLGDRRQQCDRAEPEVELKPIELECIKWAIAGKTQQDIAQIVGIPYRTVRYHINRARERYGYSTNLQTYIRAATEYGLDPLNLNGQHATGVG